MNIKLIATAFVAVILAGCIIGYVTGEDVKNDRLKNDLITEPGTVRPLVLKPNAGIDDPLVVQIKYVHTSEPETETTTEEARYTQPSDRHSQARQTPQTERVAVQTEPVNEPTEDVAPDLETEEQTEEAEDDNDGEEEEAVEEEPVAEPVVSKMYLGYFKLTAYCSCYRCCGQYALNRPKDVNGNDIVYGASGRVLRSYHSVAVDTSVIPYGSHLIINGHDYYAEDCGGAVRGNKIDVYFSSHEAACAFGLQYADVYLVND